MNCQNLKLKKNSFLLDNKGIYSQRRLQQGHWKTCEPNHGSKEFLIFREWISLMILLPQWWAGSSPWKCVLGTCTLITHFRIQIPGPWSIILPQLESLRFILMVTIKERCVWDLKKNKRKTKYQIPFKTIQLAQITSWNYKWLYENVLIPLQNS